jgi:hypothetical protein
MLVPAVFLDIFCSDANGGDVVCVAILQTKIMKENIAFEDINERFEKK